MKEKEQHRIIKVSVVEDSSDLNEILKLMINDANDMLCLSSFLTGEQAIRDIPTTPPDVVLMDLGLPGINGIECITKLKQAIPRLQFLVLTIKDQEEEIFGALKAGASGYLLKTSSPEQIIISIRELIDGGAPMSTNIARKVVNYFKEENKALKIYDELLTSREKDVLHLLSKGRYYKEIASDLFISIETVKSHCHNIYEKLHVSTRTEAVNKYFGR